MYKLNQNSSITRISDGASIPADTSNNDYARYLKWIDDGNTPTPVDAPTPAELAAAAQRVKDEVDATAAKSYAKLTALRGMTPAQVQSWVAANVTNLAQAQDAIATLAIAVSILARRL